MPKASGLLEIVFWWLYQKPLQATILGADLPLSVIIMLLLLNLHVTRWRIQGSISNVHWASFVCTNCYELIAFLLIQLSTDRTRYWGEKPPFQKIMRLRTYICTLSRSRYTWLLRQLDLNKFSLFMEVSWHHNSIQTERTFCYGIIYINSSSFLNNILGPVRTFSRFRIIHIPEADLFSG